MVRALRAEPWAFPTERAGSEGDYKCRLRRNAAYGSENLHNRASPAGNAPLLLPVATSPPEGEILATLYFELLVRVKAERRINFPLRGKWCAAPKGVHFHAPQARLFGFAAERHSIKLIAAKRRYHNPRAIGPSNLRILRPQGPVNPKNLSP
jgi:hypothetical protein